METYGPQTSKYVSGSPLEQAIHDYYCHVDEQIGSLLTYCDEETTVLVVSDHGARPLMGGVRVNEWLQQEGYLTLKGRPTTPTTLGKATMVDWKQTQAWGEG